MIKLRPVIISALISLVLGFCFGLVAFSYETSRSAFTYKMIFDGDKQIGELCREGNRVIGVKLTSGVFEDKHEGYYYICGKQLLLVHEAIKGN